MDSLNLTATDKRTHVLMAAKGRLMGTEDGDRMSEVFEGQLGLGKMNFVLDMSEMEYMNSTGLNLLLRMFTRIRNNGGELLLGSMSGKVSQLLVITKLNSVFKVHDTTADAEAKFAAI